MPKLEDVAARISSKNAGNFFVTFDLVFKDRAQYERTKAANVLTPDSMSELFGVPVRDVVCVSGFDAGIAFKVTLRRRRASGAVGETDVYGAQQYPPLMSLEVPA